MLLKMRPLSTLPRILIVPLFLLVCGLFFLPRHSEYGHLPITKAANYLSGKSLTEASSTFSKPVQDFWADVAAALLAAQPQCNPVKLDGGRIGPMADFKPLEPGAKHPERLVDFTDEDENALFRAHYLMRREAQRLGPKLPFEKEKKGIVTTVNLRYMPIFLVSLRMIRRTGCNLPVEVFIDDWDNYDATICDTVLPSLNARCVVLSNIYSTASYLKAPDHYQYKVLSIFFSTFQHVLFLDSDAFPLYDPTILLTTAPYTTHGLVTWPDYYALTASKHYYHIAAIPEMPPMTRLSSDSGQLLINKNIHRESLILMVYYNYYGPDYYYPLLSQGSHGQGDKETFNQAAMAVNLPYYQVRTPPSSLGRHVNGTYHGIGFAQADPGVDFEYQIPMRSHIHPHENWEDNDLAHPIEAVEKGLNKTRKAPKRPMPAFLHQNNLKMDPEHVLDDKRMPTYEVDGTPHRMYGFKEDMEKYLGYDVERRLWDVVAEEGCRVDQESEACGRIRAHVREVFGWMDSIERPW